MNEILVSVDTGKNSTKSVVKVDGVIIKNIFRTKVQEIANLGVELTNNSYYIEFGGKSYLVGDMLSEDKCDYNISKSSVNHQLCIYLAIVKVVDRIGAMSMGVPNIYLSINTPINIYKNKTLKEEYIKLIQRKGEVIPIKVNGRSFVFKINYILPLPEATASIYSNISNFRDKKATIIDCGSLNTSYCTFNSLVPLLDTMIIANSGINVLRSTIAERLTTFCGSLVSNDDMEEILKNEYLYIDGVKIEESKAIVEGLIREHVLEIFNYAKSRSVSFNNTTLIFTGGGTILLKKYILEIYPNAIFENDPQYANAISYYSVLEIKYNGKK
ncbi:ParM/StbA family protein [Clostridium estertheticum]|uniref:ParM/StbA family protein n=1 Tax=Clostridium estertheticum TaxID=238834 RepID=A0A7Y3WTG3_9CLOT|nr:ParM/StbA family protein [Clostridium estertheticum]NNU78147.1 ParM/StbA family protein [Clostridium estertheticum]WBL47740.1 ParM/StbA family protein [Clostridium estertheticum]